MKVSYLLSLCYQLKDFKNHPYFLSFPLAYALKASGIDPTFPKPRSSLKGNYCGAVS